MNKRNALAEKPAKKLGGLSALRKIVVSEFLTLDGVMEDPGRSSSTSQ